ncbi:MAG TPA: hypothetical protein VHP83_19955 [Aggregatilineaceae bacterium]|nr:hypothetical protein [Aggregatilineaceae bacterium]
MLQNFTRIWQRHTYGCLALAAAAFLLMIGSLLIVLSQLGDSAPDSQATRTVEAANKQAAATEQAAAHQRSTAWAAETAVLLALTPTSTYTPTFTPTNTPQPSPTPLSATPMPQVTVLPHTTYYAVTGANLRSCPHLTTACAPVGELAAGDWLSVIGQLIGDAISGNAIWYQASYDGLIVYVHSSVLTKAKPAFAPVVQPTVLPAQPQTAPQASDPFGCNGINDLDCVDFNHLGINANAHLAQCGDEDHLDGDGDGRACENW